MESINLQNLAKLIRYYILKMSTVAGSGHPTSSLSAADLMTVLFFAHQPRRVSPCEANSFFHFDFNHPDNPANDRLIFSKGHATPLFYALYATATAVKPSELETYRQFGSRLEGHATMRFPYTEAATGSLGQGLSVGVGMALALKSVILGIRQLADKVQKEGKNTSDGGPAQGGDSSEVKEPEEPPRVYVLLGDGEMSEGSIWEAINLASYYHLDNLVAIVDVNRLGQSGETMLGWDVETYQKRFEAFGWRTVVIDGHDYREINEAFKQVSLKNTSEAPPPAGRGGKQVPLGGTRHDSSEVKELSKPFAIIAKTVKGKGVSFLENQENWHGKPLPPEQFEQAVKELGKIDFKLKGKVEKPGKSCHSEERSDEESLAYASKIHKVLLYRLGDQIPTRKAYGTALARLGEIYPQVVSLDGDVKNSTYSEIFQEKYPDRFFEMFIAEQNMVGAAAGFARLGFIPAVSTFAAFFTRAYDQIRMSAITGANIKFCGSHAGVSIGEDGPSQMGLEDIAMFRAIHKSVVLYPSDAVSTEKLVEEMIKRDGICYLRTTRPSTPVIYDNEEQFPIGGCKIHDLSSRVNPLSLRAIPLSLRAKRSNLYHDKKIIIIAAGITLFEALKAQEILAKEGIGATVVDCYSIKPIDEKTLKKLVTLTTHHSQPITQIITVEDHWFDGGLGDAVLNVFSGDPEVKVYKLAVSQMPRSGKSVELLDYEKISAQAIIDLAHNLKL